MATTKITITIGNDQLREVRSLVAARKARMFPDSYSMRLALRFRMRPDGRICWIPLWSKDAILSPRTPRKPKKVSKRGRAA